MLLKTDIKIIKKLGFILSLSCLATSATFAQTVDCTNHSSAWQRFCSEPLIEQRKKLENLYLTATLVTDAPVRVIQDTQQIWLNRLQQCKSLDCYKQLFDMRADDLNIFVSLNQSLTQHYLKYENGQLAKPFVHLKIHQLSKDRIKIEGLSYRNANNRPETQTIPFLAYTTPVEKAEIIDNEHDCKYQFNYGKAILSVKSIQKGCERFSGIYRLYD